MYNGFNLQTPSAAAGGQTERFPTKIGPPPNVRAVARTAYNYNN